MLPSERQAEFAAAIWSTEAGVPGGLSPTARFAIHRNNVYAGLLATLQGRYPVIRRLLGEDCFRACMRRFIEHFPPRSPILMQFGQRLPDYIATLDDLRHLAYLSDVARLEWYQHVALHGAEAAPLKAATLAGIAPERMSELVLMLHPTAQILRSHYPVLTIWRANTDNGALPSIPPRIPADSPGQDVLIVRPREAVLLLPLPPGAAAFVLAVGRGASLADASAAAAYADSDFNLTSILTSLLRHEIFIDYSFANNPEQQ